MNYEKFSEHFLKLLLKYNETDEDGSTKEKKTDVTALDLYKVLELPNYKELLVIEGEFVNNNDYINSKKRKEVVKAYQQLALKYHPDRPGGKTTEAQEKFKIIEGTKNIYGSLDFRLRYDKNYEFFFVKKNSNPLFLDLVKKKLERLSKETEPASTMGHDGVDASKGDTGKGEDVSRYKHLFPKQDFIDRELGKLGTKAEVNRCANWIIYTYGLLRPLQDELEGKGNFRRDGTLLDVSKLGYLRNFKKDIWNHNKSLDDVNQYADQVKQKIKEVAQTGGKRTRNDYAWQDAQEENLDELRHLNIDGVTWNDLSGPENEAGKEQHYFADGFVDDRGINNLRFDDPNHYAYKNVINRAKTFLKIKAKVNKALKELDDLNDKEGGNINQFFFLKEFRSKIRELGELEKVEHASGSKYSMFSTKMKYHNANDVDPLIDKFFKLFREEIKRVGSKARNKGTGGDGGGGSGNPKNEAIQEIKSALRETGLTAEELRLDRYSDKVFTGWENLFQFGIWGQPAYINIKKNECLDIIYRVSARRKIIQELSEKSLSISILGIGNDKDALRRHFSNKKGKSEINAERDRLLSLINNQGQDKTQEIQQAIAAVMSVLRDNQLEKNQAKIQEILGENWENNFQGLKDKTEIEKFKNLLIQKIKEFIAQNKGNFLDIIKEIEETLRKVGLSEKILGENWKTKFEGKNEEEINAERERLLKLIEDEINKQEKDGKIGSGESKNKKKVVIENRKEKSKKDIDKKLKEGHQKLTVKLDELPISLFAPYKNLEEKLESLTGLEEISDFNKKLVAEINKKKAEKLEVIRDDAITEIKKELGSSKVELGQNKDFKKKIREANDPDVIELLKQNILSLIKEQKSGSDEESINNPNKPGSPDQISWPKVLGITALIVLPLMLLVFIILRVRQRKLERKRYS